MKYIFSVLLIFVTCLQLQAAEPSSALYQHYLLFSKEKALTHASWGMVIHDVTADRQLLAHNPNLHLTPASTQKLITTASALLMLGTHYQYQTRLQHDGSITGDGVLNGNLYIRGSGDPSLGARQMEDSLSLEHLFGHFTRLLQDAGIKQIRGNIFADAGLFDRELVSPKWLWEDIGNYFGAGACGLNAHENEYTVYFQAGSAEGDPARVQSVSPTVPGMEMDNRVMTGPRGSGDQVYIFGAPFSNKRTLTGTVPLGARQFPVRGSMPDPAYFLAAAFKTYLSDRLIHSEGEALRLEKTSMSHASLLPPPTTLGTWHSPDLFELVYRTNHVSVNTYAEALLKTIGYEMSKEGNTKAGLQAIYKYWADKGVDLNSARLVDGSGLSPANRISPGQLSGLLNKMAGEKEFPVFLYTLPLAGYSGSLARHFHGSSAEGVLRAKSGFLSNTIAYAGYTPMENGHLAAFVIIVNDYQGTSANMRQKILELMNSIRSHN